VGSARIANSRPLPLTFPFPRHIGNHMVTNDPRLDRTFGALADPVRRALLARLSRGDATVGELARPFRIWCAAPARGG